MIQLHACIHRVSVDREGETTLTLKIPQSDLKKTLQLMEHTETVLFMTIDEAMSQRERE